MSKLIKQGLQRHTPQKIGIIQVVKKAEST